MFAKFRMILKDRKALHISYFVVFLYFNLFLYSINNIVFLKHGKFMDVTLLNDWTSKILKSVAPFVWEPVAAIYLFRNFTIYLSLPNLIIAIILSFLVFLNIAVAVYAYRMPKLSVFLKNSNTPLAVTSVNPSFLAGLACCVPTFIAVFWPIWGGFTLVFIRIRSFFIPISIALMVVGLIWSLRKIPI
jgi:hypothetical protein